MSTWWYVLQTRPSREHQARYTLRLSGIDTTIPREMRWIRSGGNWYLQEHLLFPSYLFVRLSKPLDDAAYYLLTKPQDVLRLLGQERTALPSNEAAYIGWLSNNGDAIRPTDVYTQFFGGKQRVMRMDGFLEPVKHRVLKFDWHRRRATIAVPLNGDIKELEVSITRHILNVPERSGIFNGKSVGTAWD